MSARVPAAKANDRAVRRTAQRAGLASDWTDAFGTRRRVAPDTLRALLAVLNVDANTAAQAPGSVPRLLIVDARRTTLPLPAACRKARTARVELEHGGVRDGVVDGAAARGTIRFARPLPPGHHHLDIGGLRVPLAAAPARCYSVADALGGDAARVFGLAAQVYSLRSRGDFGYGNFDALAQLARSAAQAGAHALAISPLHALFGADPHKYSPYAPSNRCLLNVLHAAAGTLVPRAEVERMIAATGAARELATLRRARLIDWPRAAALHRRVFEQLFARFGAGAIGGEADFARFRAEGGALLAQHACFEALAEYRASRRAAAEFPATQSAAAHAFTHAAAERITFHAFLQWCAARGLAAAQASARAHGMAIGLVADLAVGVDPAGSECWSRPDDMLIGASIGAPPDDLNAIGQDWGLTTFAPVALARNGYAPFLDMLRAAMRHAGGIRLDHVMALTRLWLVPRGARAVDGAYLCYPFADLLRLVALESWRHRCIVIGEDLGTVPDDCRARLARAGILGLDVLPFMRAGETFLAPRRWRRTAVAMTSTHDIAPVAAWWRARDLDWRGRLRLFGAAGEVAERAARAQAQRALTRALSGARIASLSPRSGGARVVDAAIAAVARTPSPLAIVPVEDLVGAGEQPNLPGTVGEHPNWRRRYPADAARLLGAPAVRARLRRLARERSPV